MSKAKEYLEIVAEDAMLNVRKHADDTPCHAKSPDSCPFNQKVEAGEKAIANTTELHNPKSVSGNFDVDSGAIELMKGLKLSKPFNLTLSSAGGIDGEWTAVMNDKKQEGHSWLDPMAFSEFSDDDLEKIGKTLTDWYEKERKMKNPRTTIDRKEGRITVVASR